MRGSMRGVKIILAVLSVTLIFLMSSCYENGAGKIKTMQENFVSDHITATMTESTVENEVTAQVAITDPREYGKAEFYVEGVHVGNFNESGELTFMPKSFGSDVACEVVYYDDDGAGGYVEAARVQSVVDLSIQTWFVGAHLDLGHPMFSAGMDEVVNLLDKQHARGNDAICFRMEMRVPAGQSVAITYAVTRVTDHNQLFGGEPLDVHFRGPEYKDRNDLYEYPDEAMYHIDPEEDKWIMDGMTLEEGVHVVYVAPSCWHDLSFLQVLVGGDYRAEFTGYYKTLDFEAFGILPEGVVRW